MSRFWFLTGLSLLAAGAVLPGADHSGAGAGEVNTPPARNERHPDRLHVGDRAPDFTLPAANGGPAVTLSGFRGKKPVVLVFGSYT